MQDKVLLETILLCCTRKPLIMQLPEKNQHIALLKCNYSFASSVTFMFVNRLNGT